MTQSPTFRKFNFKFYKKSIAVPNHMIFNPELKDSSFRLLCALEAIPETGWTVHQNVLSQMLGWGRDKTQAAIADLIEKGYVRRSQHRKDGRFGNYTYEFHWEPIFKDNPNIEEDPEPKGKDDPDDWNSGSGAGGGKPVGCDGGVKPVSEEIGTTGYIDLGGYTSISNNIEEPPTPKVEKRNEETGSVGGFHKSSKIYQCLQKVDIQDKDKIRLTSQFDELTVSKSVAHCTKPGFKIQVTLDSSIFYFCKNPDHIVKTKEELQAEKLKLEDEKRDRAMRCQYLGRDVMKFLWQKARELGVYIRENSEYMEISNDRIQEKVYYSNQKFAALMAHALQKVGLEIPPMLKGFA